MTKNKKAVTVDKLLAYYGAENDITLSKKTKISKSTISKWRANGIPPERQAVFQVLSDDHLEADLSDFENLKLQTETEEA